MRILATAIICSAAVASSAGMATATTVNISTATGTPYVSPTSVRLSEFTGEIDTGSRGVDLNGAKVTATFVGGLTETLTWQNLDPYTTGGLTGTNISMFMDYRGFDLETSDKLLKLTIDLSTSDSVSAGSGRSVFDMSTARKGEPGNTPTTAFGIPLNFEDQSYSIDTFFGTALAPGETINAPGGFVSAIYSDIVSIAGSPAAGDIFSSLMIDFSGLTEGGFMGRTNFESDIDTLAAIPPVPLPAGLPLLLAGLGGLALIRRRR